MITRMAYESLALKYEAFNREGEKPEWFYIMCFKMADLEVVRRPSAGSPLVRDCGTVAGAVLILGGL